MILASLILKILRILRTFVQNVYCFFTSSCYFKGRNFRGIFGPQSAKVSSYKNMVKLAKRESLFPQNVQIIANRESLFQKTKQKKHDKTKQA